MSQLKIRLLVEDKGMYWAKSITKREIRDFYQEHWPVIGEYAANTKKLNKYQKRTYRTLSAFQDRVLMPLIHDVIDKGIGYDLGGKKSIHYVNGKPKWTKKPRWLLLNDFKFYVQSFIFPSISL